MPILRRHELLGIINGSEPCPPKFLTNRTTNEQTFNPAYLSWQKGPASVMLGHLLSGTILGVFHVWNNHI
jgi:hypothetical protein